MNPRDSEIPSTPLEEGLAAALDRVGEESGAIAISRDGIAAAYLVSPDRFEAMVDAMALRDRVQALEEGLKDFETGDVADAGGARSWIREQTGF